MTTTQNMTEARLDDDMSAKSLGGSETNEGFTLSDLKWQFRFYQRIIDAGHETPAVLDRFASACGDIAVNHRRARNRQRQNHYSNLAYEAYRRAAIIKHGRAA